MPPERLIVVATCVRPLLDPEKVQVAQIVNVYVDPWNCGWTLIQVFTPWGAYVATICHALAHLTIFAMLPRLKC